MSNTASKKANLKQETKKTSALKWLFAILFPFIIVFILRNMFLGNYFIPSGSMENTLMTNDRILITYADKANPHRGDIIVFGDDKNWMNAQANSAEQFLIKRVIAIAGDTVYSDTKGNVYVNGKKSNEPYIQGTTPAFDKQKVPADSVFVLGDNREHSADSQYHIKDGTQFISIDSIQGKMWVRYFPLNKMGTVE